MRRAIFAGLAAAMAGPCGVAEARNPHCAGGIQYVVQAMRDKDRGNIEDYEREINKAVYQLRICAEQDTNDAEALGYLGWAYAEVDSSEQAGRAFARAIARLRAKGDRKKAETAENNRDSYWATAFNEGIARINDAQNAYPDYTRPPQDDADTTLRAEAGKKYEAAIVSLTRASHLRPNDPRTLRNLGVVHGFMGQYRKAEEIFRAGLAVAPADSDLVQSLSAVRASYASRLIDDKKFDEAVKAYQELVKAEPRNANAHLGLAEAHFKRAQGREGDARRQDFLAAGDAYRKAAELRPAGGDLAFNAALAYQSAGDYALAEGQWRAALKGRPDDLDALSSLANALVELRKFDEAIRILHGAVVAHPTHKALHRQLGSAYTKAGNNAKGTEELMVYLALENGQPVADPAAAAKGAPAGTAAARTFASDGAPEHLVTWDAEDEKYESWFYWTKRVAYHFKKGTLVQKSDWTTAATKAVAGEAGK